MITVVDSPHFFRLYSSKNDVADHEELLGKEEIRVRLQGAHSPSVWSLLSVCMPEQC